MQALLASYYGLAMEQPVKREEEIDKADFIADSYTRRMLQREVRTAVSLYTALSASMLMIASVVGGAAGSGVAAFQG